MRSILVALFLIGSTAHAAPAELTHTGRIFDGTGLPISGAHDLTVTLYDAETGGSMVFSETINTTLDAGYFSIVLGSKVANPVVTADLDVASLYAEVAVDGGTPLPRQQVTAVPFAHIANTATNVVGGIVDVSEVRIDGTTVIDASGPTGATLEGLACAAAQIPLFNGVDWTCSGQGGSIDWADIVNVPLELVDGDDDQLASLFCADGALLRVQGGGWGCSSDVTLTDAEVDTFVQNGPISLFAGSTIGGVPFVTDWSNLPNIPSDIADGDDDTQLDEAAVDAFVGNNGYALSSGLATIATSGDWSDLANVPSGLDDGDDDTQLTEAEVDAFVGNNGYALSSSLATIATSGAWADLSGIPGDIADGDDDTQLDEAAVDAFVGNNGYALSSSLSLVATSGAYSDLSGTPTLATVATTGQYSDLSGTPSLASVATSGAYGDLSGTPSLSAVAISGSYNDLTDIPQKVIWHAYNGASAGFNSGQTIAYNSTTVNIGGAYNTSNGVATVPVAGPYRLCIVSITDNGTAGSQYFDLHVNGGNVQNQGGRVYSWNRHTAGDHINNSGCHIRELNAGDTVHWESQSLRTYPSPTYSWMTGELL